MQVVDTEAGRPKRGFRKLPATNVDNRPLNSSEFEKSRRTRKVSAYQTELVSEQPQNEIEKVKRNLRKVSAPAAVASDESESITGKPWQSSKKVSTSPTADVAEQGMDHPSEKMHDSPLVVYNQDVTETPPKSLPVNESIDVLHDDHPEVELHSLESSAKVENSPSENGLNMKEDQTS